MQLKLLGYNSDNAEVNIDTQATKYVLNWVSNWCFQTIYLTENIFSKIPCLLLVRNMKTIQTVDIVCFFSLLLVQ